MSGPPLKFIPPRVPLTDPRTGIISREWYLFLQGIFIRTGAEAGQNSDVIDDSLNAIYAALRPVNTAQIEQFLREVSALLQGAQRPQRDLTKRLDEIEARLVAVERRAPTDELRRQLDEARSFIFGA